MTRVWKIERGPDEMHALLMMGYRQVHRDLNRRRIGRTMWLKLARRMA